MKITTLALATLTVACTFIPGGSTRREPATVAKASKPPVIACFGADAVFYNRREAPGKHVFLGYRTLTGPVDCPAQASDSGLPAELPLAGHVMSVAAADTWDQVEQDRLHPAEMVRYHYAAYRIVFAEKSLPDRMEILAANDWPVQEAAGKRAAPQDVLLGPAPTVQSFNQWIEKLGDAHAVFDRFYQRRELAAHQTERPWYEENVYKCFEAIGRGDFCSAEVADTHPSNESAGNPLPEAWFCQAYGHLHHAPVGTNCHGPIGVSRSFIQCMDKCQHTFDSCVVTTNNTGECGAIRNGCSTKCK